MDKNAALIATHLEAADDLHSAFDWHMRAGTWSTHRDITAARMSWQRAAAVDHDTSILEPEPALLLCLLAIERHIDTKVPRYPSRSPDALDAADEDGRRVVALLGYDIQEPVQPVTKINVPDTCVAEHNGVSRCPATRGVRRAIVRTVVRLDFRDHERSFTVHQIFAKQFVCHNKRVALEEFFAKWNAFCHGAQHT